MSKVTSKTANREVWLQKGIVLLAKKFFTENGYELPEKLGVSCGFPRGGKKAIGQCFYPDSSSDGTTQMFVCPTQANRITVLGILLHEMIHACTGPGVGHKGLFKKLALEFGFAGKMTATIVEGGSDLDKALELIAEKLGDYPHAAMRTRPSKVPPPRDWIRLVSDTDPKYNVILSLAMFEEFGAPVDPWGDLMQPKED